METAWQIFGWRALLAAHVNNEENKGSITLQHSLNKAINLTGDTDTTKNNTELIREKILNMESKINESFLKGVYLYMGR